MIREWLFGSGEECDHEWQTGLYRHHLCSSGMHSLGPTEVSQKRDEMRLLMSTKPLRSCVKCGRTEDDGDHFYQTSKVSLQPWEESFDDTEDTP